MVGQANLMHQFLEAAEAPFDWTITQPWSVRNNDIHLIHDNGAHVIATIHVQHNGQPPILDALCLVGEALRVGISPAHRPTTQRTIESFSLLRSRDLLITTTDILDPIGLLARISQGIDLRGRLGWHRLEQILAGCILFHAPDATGSWEVGLHPSLYCAQGPTHTSPNFDQLLHIHRPITLDGSVLDVVGLLQDFMDTVGPIRLDLDAGIVRGLAAPQVCSIDLPTHPIIRQESLSSLLETARVPDIFV